ncbi:MAG: complex I subunit 5 family protein, partial [Sediminispirochaetaceae bacterium]
HSAAPYQVSALLSGFVIKAPMLALWKIFSFISIQRVLDGLIWVGAVCALWGVLAAMVQKDAKKLLGYHSVSQMGYIVAAFGAGGAIGWSAALFYIIAHALFKSLLFFTVGNVTSRAGTRDVYRLRGLARSFPVQTIFYFIAAASIAGVPFFAGFTGKLLVAKSLYGHPAYTLLLLAGVGTAASFVKLSGIFIGRPASIESPSTAGDTAAGDANSGDANSGDTASGDTAGNTAEGNTAAAFLGMGIVAAGCLLMGILPSAVHGFLLQLTFSSAPGVLGTPPAPFAGWYSPSHLLKAFITLAAGSGISFFLLSQYGKKISHRVRDLRVGLNGSLRLITAGFVLLILFGTRGFW